MLSWNHFRGWLPLVVFCALVLAPEPARPQGSHAAGAPADSPQELLADGQRRAAGLAAERESAVAVFARAVMRARETGVVDVEVDAERHLGELLLNLGRDLPDALAHLERAASLAEPLGRAADAARATTLAGIVLRRLGRLDDAEAAHRRALATYVRIDDRSGQAAVHHNLGALLYGRSRHDEAVEHYERSIALRRAIGELAATAGTLNNLATIHAQRGDLDQALASHREALAIADASGSRNDRAYATLGLGTQSFALGELQEAIGYLQDAAAQFEVVGDRSGLGFARHTLGVVYLALGHDTDAVTMLEQVLPLREHDPARLGTTLQSLAGAFRQQGNRVQARAMLERALALKRQASDTFGEAATLRSLAALDLDEGRIDAAIRHAFDARALAQAASDADGVALAVALWSRGLRMRGDSTALADLDRELAAVGTRRRPRTAVILRAERARVALRDGDLQTARRQVADAVAEVEQLRAAVASLDLRATYLASHADLLDLQVEILLRSHLAAPDAGHDRAAFEAAERARGRRILDALGDATLPRADTNPMRVRERELERAVNVAALKLERASRQDAGTFESLRTDLDATLLALREFRAQARTTLPWRRDAALPDLARLQRDMPADTALVSYWLGESTSVAWVVTTRAATLVDLPPGEQVRQAVRNGHSAVVSSATARAALEGVAALLLHPLEPHLTARRLAFVVDGTLEYVPFSALPTSGGDPLLTNHDVVRLPAAVWHGDGHLGRPPRTRVRPRVAVVADPVFAVDDGRVAQDGREATRRLADDRSVGVEPTPARLRFSRLEAEAIARIASDTTLLVDFDADKARVAALAASSDIDVLHLATHATQHASRPDLTGVMFSLVDASGSARDGRLRLHEVVALPLTGQTVVLSACQSVIGPELRGDGLQGLARAFMQAGAGAVVASLWDVDDRATMVLMRHFYEALVRDGLSPDRALARAQRAMQADARWMAVRHWAGFVVLGTGE